MDQRDLLFLVFIAITLTTLVVIIWQFARRRRGRDEDRGGNWWEGPWDDRS